MSPRAWLYSCLFTVLLYAFIIGCVYVAVDVAKYIAPITATQH